MGFIQRLVISPPLMNSSSPWASERDQLQEIFDSPYTGAVTTRTATLTGFRETSEHTVGLFVSISGAQTDTPWRLLLRMSP
jgi:dihydroorotate dehydrogenase (fumarate)